MSDESESGEVSDTAPATLVEPTPPAAKRGFNRVRWGSIVAGVNTALFAPLLAAAVVKRAGGFGSGDVMPFAVWTLPLAIAVTVSAAAVFRLSWRAPQWSNGIAIAVGAVMGVLYAIALYAVVGPMLYAFSFPLLYLWALAAAIGLWIGHYVAGLPNAAERAKPVVTKGTAFGCLGAFGAAIGIPIVLMLLSQLRRA